MSDAYCTPGREPRSVAASYIFFAVSSDLEVPCLTMVYEIQDRIPLCAVVFLMTATATYFLGHNAV